MSNRRKIALLGLGLFLILAAVTVYTLRIGQTPLPAGEGEQLTDQSELDRPLALQNGIFLLLFIPGLLVLGIAGMTFSRRSEPLHKPATLLVILLLLFTYGLIATNYLILAPASATPGSLAFWLIVLMAVLALVNFAGLLAIWNGYRRGMLLLVSASFLLLVLNLMGGVALLTTLFEVTAVIVVYILIRPAWIYME